VYKKDMENTQNKSGIYAIINTQNGKRYVGSAVNLHNRFCQHRRLLDKGKHKNIYLQNAWNKFGESCFEFIVIEHCPVEQLIDLEQRSIDEQSEYNISPTAGNSLGVKRTPEFKAKISAAVKGRKHSAEARSKMSAAHKGSNGLTGRPCSTETRAKIAMAQSGEKHRLYGKHHTEETKQKMSAAISGNKNYLYGKHLSEETRAKMSISLKGKVPWNKGVYGVIKASDETRAKMSASRTGKKHTLEARAKMSKSHKTRIESRPRPGMGAA
jgi:group I intron endonuclease